MSEVCMKTSERLAGDISIIDVQGRIQFGDGAEDCGTALNAVIEAGRVKLIINLAEVPYVDSAGISELVRAYVSVGKRGGRLKLLRITRRVRELLSMTKLLTVFESFDSEEEAIASFGAEPPAP
jgi:anti-sigma B factor antagonist